MAVDDYIAHRTGLLLVDPYNDLLSDGGKLWPQAKAVAEAVDLLAHLRALVEAGRRAGIVVFYLPHRQWREGNYDGWRHPGPWQTSTDREAVFVFETEARASVLETLLTEPRLWKAAAAWRSHLAGLPRVADVAYSWKRPRPATNGASQA